MMLANDAISAFDNDARALTVIHGTALAISVNGYALTTQRDGAQANQGPPRRATARI